MNTLYSAGDSPSDSRGITQATKLTSVVLFYGDLLWNASVLLGVLGD
jgi:hypothetical protein